MMVVDSNVIAYCWIRGERTGLAQRVRLRDPAWHAPILWRSELRSALSGYIWHGLMDAEHAAMIANAAEQALSGCEHLVASASVLELAASTRISAYDCEFVALARSLAVPLVTEDRAVLKAFPDVALTMEAFLAASEPPALHQRAAAYRTRGREQRIRPRP